MLSGDPVVLITGFNPRAPGGARRALILGDPNCSRVSIHAPRAERDMAPMVEQELGLEVFQSTRPGRSATI